MEFDICMLHPALHKRSTLAISCTKSITHKKISVFLQEEQIENHFI